ncbi:[LSU ribosomal protein L11P]-lysine N-methyltransferase [Bacteriovorax stolpii]|uniref:50S ribosomal protein L11 methyltransferase n=1 Tax=Bacteriovorax stolpii TaxID=960 RepID=UPI0010E11572|nr:50S ribosomal protein L11 methyltransferase [Bacteriovorax stolpii]TDP53884.1 [LSU ribosomal protein L11P]-lysine N-methyltransferase [Bacteriovorax stolpii]
MENKKFNFVLLGYNRATIEWSPSINAYALEDFNCDGVEEFSLEEARVDEILGERAYSGGDIPETLIDEVQEATINQDAVTYKYFFYEGDYEKNAADFISFIKENYPEISLYSAQRDFEDWNAEWKKFYNPIHVSDNIEIIPEWMADTHVKKARQQVYIYPGMGFGTGTHETTFLCMVLFDQVMNEFNNKNTCLDFGCGSGILGIAAMKTKQMQTHFVDIDRSALENCTQNLVLNFAGENLEGTELVIRERYNPKKYDLVFANILEHVLISEKPTIDASLKSGGYLIVSGILNHQVETIVNAYSKMEKVSVVSKGDWSAILFKDKV